MRAGEQYAITGLCLRNEVHLGFLLLRFSEGVSQGIMTQAFPSRRVSVYSIPAPYHPEQADGQVRDNSCALQEHSKQSLWHLLTPAGLCWCVLISALHM